MSHIYLFVRSDLSIPQQIIQTSHAVDQLVRELSLPLKKTVDSMVLFGVDSEIELLRISNYLTESQVRHHTFFEPDVDEFTAIATEPLSGSRRNLMKNFNLKGN